MATLSQQQKKNQKIKALKAKAHHLKPVIIIGDKGLTENVIAETDRTLLTHELIKVRINALDREARNAIAEKLTEACQADIIQMIGHVAVIYRPKPE